MRTVEIATAKGYRKCLRCGKEYYLIDKCECDALHAKAEGDKDE